MSSNPAFPVSYDDGSVNLGMTLHDFFAAAALTGLIASCGKELEIVEAADRAFSYAEAMVAARDEWI